MQLDFDLYLIGEKLILGTKSNFNGFAGKDGVLFWSRGVASKVSGVRCQVSGMIELNTETRNLKARILHLMVEYFLKWGKRNS